MKSKLLFCMVVAALLATGCSNEEEFMNGGKQMVLQASAENDALTRVGFVEETGAFYWSADDQLGVGNIGFTPLKLTSGAGTGIATFRGYSVGSTAKYAIYPHHNNHRVNGTTLTYEFPATYEYDSRVDEEFFQTISDGTLRSWNPPMFGEIVDNKVTLKHLGAVFCLRIDPMPVTTGTLKFMVDKYRINGPYTATIGEVTQIDAETVTGVDEQTVTISFSELKEGQAGVFYIPVPVGKYQGIRIEIPEAKEPFSIFAEDEYDMERCDLQAIYINEKNLVAGGEVKAETLKDAAEKLATSEGAVVKAKLSGTENEIIIPAAPGQTKTLTLESIATATENGNNTNTKLTIKEAADTSQPQNFVLVIPEGVKLDLDIQMPYTTVTLKNQYGTVLSQTASQTLILAEGTSIETLQVKEGNVRVSKGASVTAIERASASDTDETIYVYVEEGATVDNELPDNFEKVSAAYGDLIAAIQKGGEVNVTEKIDETIDFSTLELAGDLTLGIKAPVAAIKLGGNNSGSESAPKVVIEVASGVEYPVFTFNDKTYNLTLRGDASSVKTLKTNLSIKGGKNITISGIKFETEATNEAGGYSIDSNTGVENLTIENCEGVNCDTRFINIQGVGNKNITIKGNKITCASAVAAGLTHPQDPIFIQKTSGPLTIEGNKITGSLNHHGIFVGYSTGKVTITGNTVTNATEDGIKVDGTTNATITNNTIVNATFNGIRLDNFTANATVVVTGNKIGSQCAINTSDNKQEATYGIYLKKGNNNTVTLTAKDNSVVEGGSIGNDNYFKVGETIKLAAGDYEIPFNLLDGVALMYDGGFGITNEKGLKWVADISNGVKTHELVSTPGNLGWFESKTIKLFNDLDLSSFSSWKAIGSGENAGGGANFNGFAGTFDGNNKTISGLTASAKGTNPMDPTTRAGLFGNLVGGGLIKNVTLSQVNVSSECFAGALVAYCYGSVQNCHVDGGIVSSTHASEHVGGLIGYIGEGNTKAFKITNNTVKNLTVKGTYHVGGLVGASQASGEITGNTVETVTLESNQQGQDGAKAGSQVNGIVGWDLGAIMSNNEAKDVTIKIVADGITITNKDVEISNANGMVYANNNLFAKSGYSYKLTKDVDMINVTEYISNIGSRTAFTFDGDGKTISNWSTNVRALFAPHTQENIVIKNLILKNCTVNQEDEHGNANAAGLLIGFSDNGTGDVVITDCEVIGGKLIGKKYVGAFVGYNSRDICTITDCKVNGTEFIGGGSTGAIAGHVSGGGTNTTTISKVSVLNCKIVGEDAEHTGIVVGTAHVGNTTITTEVISGNTVLNASNNSTIFGRFLPGSTGKLTVNGEQQEATQ